MGGCGSSVVSSIHRGGFGESEYTDCRMVSQRQISVDVADGFSNLCEKYVVALSILPYTSILVAGVTTGSNFVLEIINRLLVSVARAIRVSFF